ncbi:MAG: hypothetical protein R3F43_09170 [bacterium]
MDRPPPVPHHSIYVAPKGQFAIEYRLRSTTDLENFSRADAKKYRSIYEIEPGLGHRLRRLVPHRRAGRPRLPSKVAKESAERYALADWGEIFGGNPTLYFEYGREGAAATSPRASSCWRRGHRRACTPASTGARARPLRRRDQRVQDHGRPLQDPGRQGSFPSGPEVEVEFVDVKGSRFDFVEKQYVAGPSLSWQPGQEHAPALWTLLGIAQEKTDDGDESTVIWQNWVVVGWNYRATGARISPSTRHRTMRPVVGCRAGSRGRRRRTPPSPPPPAPGHRAGPPR